MENYNCHYFNEPVKIVEGFDMVGKSTFIKEILKDSYMYHPTHDVIDETLGRNYAWTIGYGIVDFLLQMRNRTPDIYRNLDVTIDRGVMSSYVYQRLYGNSYLSESVINYYANNDFFKNIVGHIYIVHHDTSTAEEIFNSAKERDADENKVSRDLDNFKSFRDYWILYSNADLLFREIYKKLGITPRVFETLPNHTWEEVLFR